MAHDGVGPRSVSGSSDVFFLGLQPSMMRYFGNSRVFSEICPVEVIDNTNFECFTYATHVWMCKFTHRHSKEQ